MGRRVKTVAIGVGAAATACGLGAIAAQPQQQVTGPIAVYWMSAATSTGFGAGMMGGGAGGGGQRPGMGSAMSMMMGGGMNPNQVNKDLTLQLGSSQRPSGAAEAEHLPPAGLRAGQSLPLVTPAPVREVREPVQEDLPMQRPKGRMLIFWGCGEHAPAGQPFVIDFSKIGPGQPIPQMPQMVAVRSEQGPANGRNATYGDWPNNKTRTRVPAQGSLVGPHTVQGTYSPPINFNLGPNQDFMPPLQMSSGGKTPGGATLLSWQSVPGANGYFAMMFGAGGGGGRGGDETVVMWSSSQSQTMGANLLDYLSPSEARRLVTSKVVMSPQTTSCAVPMEVTQAAPNGFIQMIAYGDEANFSDPPRPSDPKIPWKINWTTKVRFKSTASSVLGMDAMMGGRGAQTAYDDEDEDGPPQRGAPNRGRPGQAQRPPQQQQAPSNPAGAIMRGLGRGLLP
jgi:hypothetical protein